MTPPFSGREFESLYQASLDPMMVTSPSGRIYSANPSACRVLGRSEEELCRVGTEGVVDPTDDRLEAAMEARRLTGQFSGELRFVRANGQPFPVELTTSLFCDDQGKPRSTLIFRDISERKQTEEKLRLSEEKFAKVFRTSPDGISITRLADGRYQEVNEGFTALSGYLPHEVVGKTSLELGVWLEPQQREAFAKELAERGEVRDLETPFQFKNGVLKTCLVSARRIEIGGETCILTTTRDISERLKMAESLQQIQRLEALGVLAGGIAHDFNNMLGGLFGFLELAQEYASQGRTERIPYFLERALGIHAKAKGLTRQLLTFAKGGGPIKSVVSLEPLVRQAVSFALSGSEVEVSCSLAADLWSCECDESQIGQVIDNLVLNARQAMGGSGRLEASGANVLGPAAHPGPFVCLTVRDHGPGIAVENLSKIFDPFFSTKEDGHGLGLATVFSVTNRHGGWVEAESTPGQGATFRVYLPARLGAAEAKIAGEAGPHRGSGAVLVMDDDAALREVLEGWLTAMGYRVTSCAAGEMALHHFERARALDDRFRAVLLDLTVPGGQGGATVVASMRAADPFVVLVAISGYSESTAFLQPKLSGFTARIAKPFLKKDLEQVLRATLGDSPPEPPSESHGSRS